MDTLLNQFCKDFDAHLRPILAPLEGASQAASAADDDLPGKELLPQLLDLGLQFRALVDKVAEQQAYVLIFGPLKSGKSTLMNAVCAAYVSEVTALPAYPCMVYVSHSDSLRFIVTRYNGETQHFTDPTALRMEITRAHGELAEQIREVETRGEVFDPATHYPKAIRRVDVKVPAGELEQSGAVLVDTPGLYARMKFGYDQMTRDFRNAAACAIFVVKSDNLFLEQVFEEFTHLLDLFSRIFLVVNLDTNKRDLKPDGTQTASLEREDPLRIIEAFENLAMSAPLKAAADEGRLRIYPVDLLNSASRRMLEKRGRESDTPQHDGEANFESFLGDLSEYLNSTEYLVAFLSDSLRRASSLLGETEELLASPRVVELAEKLSQLESEREDAKSRHDALTRLTTFDWESALGELQGDLEALARDWAGEIEHETTSQLEAELTGWFATDESLQQLNDERFKKALQKHRERLGSRLYASLSERVGRGAAGVALPDETSSDLRTARVHLDELGRQSLPALDARTLCKKIGTPVSADDVPVKRAIFWDWFLFRSQASVRRRLVGESDSPDETLPVAVKERYLGDAAEDALRESLDAFRGRFYPDSLRVVCDSVLGDYASSTAALVAKQLEAARQRQAGELEALEARLGEHRQVLDHLKTLAEQTDASKEEIERIVSRYESTEPVKLMQPYRPDDAPAAPADGADEADVTETTDTAEVELEEPAEAKEN